MDVKQGMLRGNKKAFILKKEEYDNLNESEKKFFRPLACADTIVKGRVIKKLYIWYPYDKNGLMIDTEEQLVSLAFSYQCASCHARNAQEGSHQGITGIA